jgi:hypothetical protein
VHCAGLLCKWAYCCRANLAVYTTAVCINAKTLAFLVRSVVSPARLVSSLVYIYSRASYKGCNRLLCVAVLSALASYIIVYLLLGVYVPDGGSACNSEL